MTYARTLLRTFLATVALALAFAAPAAVSVADRSPFAQGHWWDPTRSGNGFDIFNAGGGVMVIWYTFDESSRPVWYTAQGAEGDLGSAWPLHKHRWANGRKQEPVVVGSLTLTLDYPEAAQVAWQLGARSGTWSIQPFIVSGVLNEVDHSGSWFDPANSGWGLNVTEQGDVLGGVLFTYDAAGDPTWVAGFARRTASPEMFVARGACPGCTSFTTTLTSAGHLDLRFLREWEMTLGNRLSVPMAAGVDVEGARLVQLSRPASSRAADRQLAAFDTDAALKKYLDAGMLYVRAGSGVDFSAPPPAAAFSTTNLQETGVDEADVVKSDGRYIYTFAYANGARQPTIRIVEVVGDGAGLQARGTVSLNSGAGASLSSAGLFLTADRLVSISGTQPMYADFSAGLPWTLGTTNVEVFGLGNRALPATLWRADIDGHLVASRRIGNRLYVVTRYVPYLPGFIYGASTQPYLGRNLELLFHTPLSGLLPKLRINGGEAQPALKATDVHIPPQGSRPPVANLFLVTEIALDAPGIVRTIAVAGHVETLYASTASLFLASTRYELRTSAGGLLPIEPSFVMTDLHQVALGADGMRIVASGSVEGFLADDAQKAPFRMSEHAGKLRVVSSSRFLWQGGNRNRLTILEPSALAPGLLKTVSWLPNDDRPQAIGKPNEILYGTRFVGDRLYAVTFKRTDPLYVIDLANAADPRITGELEVPGFSDYLHPLPNGLLLGFGKDARPTTEFGDGQFAWFQGLQLTLFDVSDLGRPREIQRLTMGKRGSDSALLRHHHAFSALPRGDGSLAIGIPGRIHDGVPVWGSGDSTTYAWKESGLMRFEVRGSTPATASLVQLPSLITHTATAYGTQYFNDPAAYDGRSILFPNATIYVGNGQLWRQDAAGNPSGPF